MSATIEQKDIEQFGSMHTDRVDDVVRLGLENLGGVMLLDGFVEGQEVDPVMGAESIDDLLERYEKPESDAWPVEFHELPPGISVYNASKMFKVGEIPHMLVREEEIGAGGEFTSKLAIYQCSEDGRDCYPAAISNLSELTAGQIAQDPAISYVKGNWVVTWVEVKPNDPNDPTQGSAFKSVTAIGGNLDKLERLVESDEGTKGVRYVGLPDGRIGVTTRTSKDGEYKMCFTIADSWKDITAEFLASAKEIKGLEGLVVNDVSEEKKSWIGPNDMVELRRGVSLLFHIGRFEPNDTPDDDTTYNRVYDVAHCVLIPGTADNPAQALYPEIIARAADFNIPLEILPPKRPDLEFVAYPSCLSIASARGGEATLLAALRDAGEVGQQIPDPLKQWRVDHPEFADNPFPQSADQLSLAA